MAGRLLSRTPTRLLSTHVSAFPPPSSGRSYHSYERESAPPFSSTEEAILSASMQHVPEYGFTDLSLAKGTKDAGYLAASAAAFFPQGAFNLVRYHLVTQRLALKDRVQFPAAQSAIGKVPSGGKTLGVGAKVRILAWDRLLANRPIIHRWQEALAIMAHPSYVGASLSELARLSDEIWFLAGDKSVDFSWYTKRATLSAIYSSTEVFMTQDHSPNFPGTQRFLDRRLEDNHWIGSNLSGIGAWLDFTGHAITNTLRSKGVRI